MLKWNISTDRAQRVDEKTRVIWLVIMFSPRVMVIKMSKMANFRIFSWWQQKINHDLSEIIKSIWKRLRLFWKTQWIFGSWTTIDTVSTLKNTGFRFRFFCWLSNFFDISTLNISWTLTPKPINHAIFWKNSIRFFNCTQTATNFLLSSAEV